MRRGQEQGGGRGGGGSRASRMIPPIYFGGTITSVGVLIC